MNYIDLRSDTVTFPTQKMRDAMFTADVGDDVYEDDPTVKKLEKLASKVTSKEAALFVPSGTFGNQLALFTHCNRGDEVLLGDNCHIVAHEVGAASVIAGVQLRTLSDTNGALDPEEIALKIRGENIHYPKTGLICLENAHSNGNVIPLENMKNIFDIAKSKNVPVHLDGARLFNAATFLGVQPHEITNYCDSVMFCLSKGLCAPMGSILAGTHEFINEARKGRKLMGGGLRQAGFLAAPGIIAIEEMSKRLHIDHENAKYMANELSKIPGILVDHDNVQINMVFFDFNKTGIKEDKLMQKLTENNIKANPPENGFMRFVTHYWISIEDIDKVIKAIKELL